MESLASRTSTRVFTPRSRSLRTVTNSQNTSQAASPTPSLRSPQRNVEPKQAFLPKVTTWDPNSAPFIHIGIDTQSGSLKQLKSHDDVKQRYAVALGMQPGQMITMQGIVDVCVLEGSISVYEHKINAASGWSRVYSPTSHPLACIRAIGASNADGNGHEDINRICHLWNGAIEEKCEVVVVLRMVDCGLNNIGSVMPAYSPLFRIKPLWERKGVALPKQSVKRRLALTRIKSMIKDISADGKEDVNDTCSNSSDHDSSQPGNTTETQEGEDIVVETIVEQVVDEYQLQMALGVAGATPVLYLTQELQLVQSPQSWADVLDQASRAPLQLNEEFEPTAPIYVVAGGQGLGKSTFCRLLTNRLLDRFGQVFYMDTDLGQSEFAAPGALSLTLVDSPILGPPFTHTLHREFVHAVYMGVVSPKNDPDRYVVAIEKLAAVYRDYVSRERDTQSNTIIPLVVNTQGWIKNLGLDLHYSLCEQVRPTNYIQVYDPAAALAESYEDNKDNGYSVLEVDKMAPLIDFESIENCNPQVAWISAMNFDRAVQELCATQQRHRSNLVTGELEPKMGDLSLSSPVTMEPPSNRKGLRLNASDMRTLSLLSHLYACHSGSSKQADAVQYSHLPVHKIIEPRWNMNLPVAAQQPFSISWTDLIIWMGEEDVPPSQILRALNGTLVGLICVARMSDTHVWTDDVIRGLYTNGISTTQAAVELSEPGSRIFAPSIDIANDESMEHKNASMLPRIVYGQPNVNATTFVAHAVVRSIDVAEKRLLLLLPPLLLCSGTDILHRVVGLVKGPGTGAFGLEMPVWAMTDGGFAERAMGSSAKASNLRKRRRLDKKGQLPVVPEEVNLGIQEAPYLSLEIDGGIGASTLRAKGGLMRRALQ
ncbi:Polynucleotide 5'-hydroxyl-kinase grc3 [Coemansia brasiliensis]|uniref:Polynucleotide 5'-hydroxyl-kinase GRC3 n=1 Tax=Coemansia brasiliensis TaxID=2650707 RepID=A0A9W8IDE7_9FUNG|nr:Polynucleotide 5'-hydroxyl-kinase grc3 [Coemansia brasiliensis]